MGGYIFRPPAAAVDLSWKLEDLLTWLARGGREMGIRGLRERQLGSTVAVRSLSVKHPEPGQFDAYVRVTLYETDIARIYEDRVQLGPIDSHQSGATRWWTERILASNVEGHVQVFSDDWHYIMRTDDGLGLVDTPLNNATIRRTA